jgi:DNA-binding transcriptional MerR regulator
MDPLSVILALRIITQVGMTVEQIQSLLDKGDSLSEADVAAILASDRAEILENLNN